LTGVVVAEDGGDGVGDHYGMYLVEYSAGVALGSVEAAEGGRGVASCHDGFTWPVILSRNPARHVLE
jgi:hypothetical protein